IYASNPKMSPTFASLLFMIVNKLPNNKQSHIDYYIDNLFSQLNSSELKKYYLPIFSIISDDVGKGLFNRLQDNIDVYIDYCGAIAPVLRTLTPPLADNSSMSADAAPLLNVLPTI